MKHISERDFFKAVEGALENWDFANDEQGTMVKAGLEKILAEKINLSANVAPHNNWKSDKMWDDINFQARYIMESA